VSFQNAVGLITTQPQGLGELVLGDPLLAIEPDEKRLPGLAVEVGSVSAELLLDLAGDLEDDRHGPSGFAQRFDGALPRMRGEGWVGPVTIGTLAVA